MGKSRLKFGFLVLASVTAAVSVRVNQKWISYITQRVPTKIWMKLRQSASLLTPSMLWWCNDWSRTLSSIPFSHSRTKLSPRPCKLPVVTLFCFVLFADENLIGYQQMQGVTACDTLSNRKPFRLSCSALSLFPLFHVGTLKMQDWDLRDWNLRHERGQKCRGGKCDTENGGQKMQGWKMRD